MANKVRSEDVPLLSQDVNEEAIHEVLEKVIDFAADYFGWHMYHTGMCCAGSPYDYKIEDVTGCAEMTKQQVIVMVKERLGINIVIVD